jgi:hypothetical protein
MRPLAQNKLSSREIPNATTAFSNTTMPKSKRAKVVHLTKVDKKGKELTIKLFDNVRACLDQYQHCFVFSVENMRNTYLKDVRTDLSDSRFVLSQNSER